MAEKIFHLFIATPDRTLFNGEVAYLSVPGAAGYFGLLPDHAPIITSLQPGVFQIQSPSKEPPVTFTTKHGGLFEFNKNQASILLDVADSAVMAST